MTRYRKCGYCGERFKYRDCDIQGVQLLIEGEDMGTTKYVICPICRYRVELTDRQKAKQRRGIA